LDDAKASKIAYLCRNLIHLKTDFCPMLVEPKPARKTLMFWISCIFLALSGIAKFISGTIGRDWLSQVFGGLLFAGAMVGCFMLLRSRKKTTR
jgi:hypothetical protein